MAKVVLPSFLVGDDNEAEATEAAKKGVGLAVGIGIAALAVAAGTIGANQALSAAGQNEVGDLY